MGEDENASLSHFSLLCQEYEASFNEEKEDEEKTHLNFDKFDPCFCSENENDFFQNLVWRERSDFRCKNVDFQFSDCLDTSRNWLKSARLESIEWVFNRREIFGFKFHTAYLCITYFDRFLSSRSIDEGKIWAVRLLSVACLSLAAKMEEIKVPALSEYQVEDFDFGNNVIQRMELLVLCSLEWKMNLITPFAYLKYFINKFCVDIKQPKGLVLSQAVEFIMAITKEIDLVDCRPSNIAAAAVLLAASNGESNREKWELHLKSISSFGSLEYEQVEFCSKLMQKTETSNAKTPKSTTSSNLSPMYLGSIDGTKRRLTYSERDRDCPVKKIRPP